MELKQHKLNFHGIPWTFDQIQSSKGFHGTPWNFKNGIPWNSVELRISQKKNSMEFHGIPRDFFEGPRNSIEYDQFDTKNQLSKYCFGLLADNCVLFGQHLPEMLHIVKIQLFILYTGLAVGINLCSLNCVSLSTGHYWIKYNPC